MNKIDTNKTTKLALVLGVTGGFGKHLAIELLNQGWNINTLIRSGKSLPECFLPYYESNQINVFTGDARDSNDVKKAAQDCSVMVYGLNVPYAQWKTLAIELLEVSIDIAEKLEMTLVFPGNVYTYDPKQCSLINEETPMSAPTSKGEIRIEMEQRLKLATTKGAKVLILRAGDFIGKDAPSTWMQFLVKQTKTGYKLTIPTENHDLNHSWCYLPDLARYAVALLDQPTVKQPFQTFHVPGLKFTFKELRNEIERTTGKTVAVNQIPWWLYALISPFVPFIREIISMRYLWESELDLDGTKLNRVLPEIKTSSLSEALIGFGFIEASHDQSI